jgi:hypothetical protein
MHPFTGIRLISGGKISSGCKGAIRKLCTRYEDEGISSNTNERFSISIPPGWETPKSMSTEGRKSSYYIPPN